MSAPVQEPAEVERAIELIHGLAGAEVAYDHALNRPGQRGLVGATKTMERARLALFELAIGRKPTAAEREQLVFGDG